MVEPLPSKQMVRVRFSSPAPLPGFFPKLEVMSAFSALRPTVVPVSLGDLLERLPYRLSNHSVPPSPSTSVSGVTMASNDVEPGWIFVAVPGTRHGINFMDSAVEGGAVAVVTDEEGRAAAIGKSVPIVIVDDPRRAAADLSAAIYAPAHATLPVIGVTGTNGKTTTTYFTRAACSAHGGSAAVLGTLEVNTSKTQCTATNTTQEVPVVQRALALAAEEGARAAVVEVSSHGLELDRVGGIHFNVGVFTNLQHDHLDFHGTMENYLAAKARLFEPGRTDAGVICVDDKWGRELVQQTQIPVQAVQAISKDVYESGGVPLWRVASITSDPESGGSRFLLVTPEGEEHIATCPLPGEANVQDAALALVAAVTIGVPLDEAILGLSEAPPVDGRSHWVQKPNPYAPAVIVDFAHTPEAVELLLDVARPMATGKVIGVFGTEGDRDPSKREGVAEAFARKADILYVTDENPRTENASEIRAQLMRGCIRVRPDLKDVHEVTTGRKDAIRIALQNAEPGDLVVLAGKGAERVQKWADRQIPFYDPEVAAEVLESLGLLQN